MWQGTRAFDDSVYINGFPITALRPETSDTDGKTYETQWFERSRFEQHPENPAPFDVLLGLLGTVAAEGRQNEAPFRPVTNPGGGIVWFQETGHTLGDNSEGGRAIATYWNRLGGIPQFGFPLSQPFMEQSRDNGQTYLVQYFERQRFEYHPEQRGTRYEVLLGRLGVEQSFGPVSGDLAHNREPYPNLVANVRLLNQTLESKFYNPYDLARNPWDYFVTFRTHSKGSFVFVVTSSKSWTLLQDGVVAQGTLPNLDVSATGSNVLKVVAKGARGELFVNGQLIANVDLSSNMTAGYSAIGSGLYIGNRVPGAATRYENFTIRPSQGQPNPQGNTSGQDCTGIPPSVNMDLLTPNCQPIGSIFDFVGRGFKPGENVASWLTLPDGRVDGETFYGEAGSDGRRPVRVTVGTDHVRQPGIYAITMEGTESHNKAIGYYKVLSK
jgi:hypothetical protein